MLQSATRQAGAIDRGQDLSGIRVGLHDEIFQDATPVLAGVDAQSTYCHLLAAERRRDVDTWSLLVDELAAHPVPGGEIADRLRTGQRLNGQVLAVTPGQPRCCANPASPCDLALIHAPS